MENFWAWVATQLKAIGLDWLADNIAWLGTTGIGAALAITLPWLYKQGNAWYKARKEKKAKQAQEARSLAQLKDLHPYFTEGQVEKARKLYIETQGQNVPPSRDDEPGRPHAFTTREPLIPKFLEEAFSNTGEDDRFYLILADSGMGKTTFMINLYLRYLEKTQGREFQIRLFPLGYPDVDQEVKKLVQTGEDRRTILLLDAFDEDGEAAKDYRRRMDEWVALFKNFREVVITSRTQFFPNEAATAGLLSIPRHDPAKPGFHQFKVMYLSPFNDADITEYLNRKFPDDDPKARKNRVLARQIVEKSPYLMVRPMLLAHIDDLLGAGERDYRRTCDIYEVLIDKWLDREAGREREHPEQFREELLRFSKHLAVAIYQNWRREERLYISREGLAAFASAYAVQLKEIDMTSRSLLNRDATGNVKFSHKSILEYFLVERAREDPDFFRDFRYEGLDVARKFLQEYGLLPEMIRIEGGSFQIGSNENDDEKPVHQVQVAGFELGKYPVTQRQWQAIMGDDPSHFKGEYLPVENVSWEDCQAFIKKLNEQTGLVFRLPTEAEWEYAAGGGEKNRTKWAGTNDEKQLGDYAWYSANSGSKTHPVGQKKPNGLGLYDMSGNVWEWCEDWYGSYPSGAQTNPQGPSQGSYRVNRGGGWLLGARNCRVSYRNYGSPELRYDYFGFRFALSFQGDGSLSGFPVSDA